MRVRRIYLLATVSLKLIKCGVGVGGLLKEMPRFPSSGAHFYIYIALRAALFTAGDITQRIPNLQNPNEMCHLTEQMRCFSSSELHTLV